MVFVMKFCPFKCFRYCFVVLTLITLWSSHCLAFSRYEENNSPVELLTRTKALYSLQKYLPEPMPDATDTSGVVNNDLPDTGLIAIGGMVFSFVKAWLTSEENNDYPDKLTTTDEVSLVTVKSDADELLFNTYQFELLSETSDSDTFQVNYRFREVPNTKGPLSSRSPGGGGSSSKTTHPGNAAAMFSRNSASKGGACGGGGGGGDKKPDGTNYSRLADNAGAIDISDIQESLEALYQLTCSSELPENLQGLQLNIMNTKIKALNLHIGRLQSELKTSKSEQGSSNRTPFQTPSTSTTRIDDEIRKLNDQIRTLELKIEGTNRNLVANSNNMTRLQERLAGMEQRLNNMEASPVGSGNQLRQVPQPESYNGILLWRIDSFNQRRNDAINGVKTAMYSKPFCTGEFGYKCCAKIYLNGDGFGKGSHISLFFVVMRGEYDALQSWPFQKKITMMLLDQGNGDHMIDAFHSDPQSSSFQRPKNDLNIASGSPLFMPLESLANGQYLKDDVIFIKIIVN